MEEWKDIEGYEGLYQVSNYGRVKSLKFGKEKILKPRKNKYGYFDINLCNESKVKGFRVNRLVALTFIPNPNNYPQVNHKDENKLNNCVDNLEWCDRKYNCNFGTRNERVAEKLTNNSLTSKNVYQYSINGELIKIWESTHECGRNGFNRGNITSCCNGKLKTSQGYIWSYNKTIS